MCIPSPRVNIPSPQPDAMTTDAQNSARSDAQTVRSGAKGDVLEKGIRRARGGGGRRSLLSKSGRGGMGFFDQYMDQ